MKTRIALCAAFLLALSAFASEADRLNGLTLERALELAEQLQPEILAAKASAEAAAGRIDQAGKIPNPEAVTRVEAAPLRGRSDAEYIAGISQNIPLGKRLSKAREVESLDRHRLEHESAAKKLEVHQRVHSAFAIALYQEKAKASVAEMASSAEKLVQIMKARLKAGDASTEELARAEMEFHQAQVELKRASTLNKKAVLALTTAIGNPSLQVNSLAGSLDVSFEIPTIEELAASLAHSPALAALEAEAKTQSARVDLAKAQRIPDINVDLLYRRVEATGADAFDIGLRIPLPIFDRGQGKIREARAASAAADAQARSKRNTLQMELANAHLQLTSALGNQKILKQEILPRAETILQSVEARYAQGDIGLSEVLPMRREWANVQLAYLESLREVSLAWASLSPYLK